MSTMAAPEAPQSSSKDETLALLKNDYSSPSKGGFEARIPIRTRTHRHTPILHCPSIESDRSDASVATSRDFSPGSRASSIPRTPLASSTPPWHTEEVSPQAYGYDLPCEFGYIGCDVRFHATDWEFWISHSMSHFGSNGPPAHPICTICGNAESEASLFGGSENPENKWRKRMIHLGEHWSTQSSGLQLIPDYNALRHLFHNDLITNEDFGVGMKQIEAGKSERAIPVLIIDHRSPIWDKREEMISHDLEKEERSRRRSKRQYKQWPEANKNAHSQLHATKRQVIIADDAEPPSYMKTLEQRLSPEIYYPLEYRNLAPDVMSLSESISEAGESVAVNLDQITNPVVFESEHQDDATDWKEDGNDSSEDDLFQDIQNQGDSPLGTFVLPDETKAIILRQCIAKYNSLLRSELSQSRTHGTSESSGSKSGTHSQALPISPVQRTKAKRSRDKNDNGDHDDCEDRRSNQPEEATGLSECPSILSMFACPFRKRDPQKYSVHIREWRNCALKEQKGIARVKGHLYRYHMIYQCPRCKVVLPTEDELDDHVVALEGCQSKPQEPVDGVTIKMKRQIQSRKRAHPRQTEAGKWQHIYQILFPGETAPDPYFEPVQDFDIQSTADFEEFVRQEIRQRFEVALQKVNANASGGPIEGNLREKILAALDESQDEAFSAFRHNQDTNISSRYLNSPQVTPEIDQLLSRESTKAAYHGRRQAWSSNQGFRQNSDDTSDSGYVSNASGSKRAEITTKVNTNLKEPGFRRVSDKDFPGQHIPPNGTSSFANEYSTSMNESSYIRLLDDHANSLPPIAEHATNIDELNQDINWESEFIGASSWV